MRIFCFLTTLFVSLILQAVTTHETNQSFDFEGNSEFKIDMCLYAHFDSLDASTTDEYIKSYCSEEFEYNLVKYVRASSGETTIKYVTMIKKDDQKMCAFKLTRIFPVKTVDGEGEVVLSEGGWDYEIADGSVACF